MLKKKLGTWRVDKELVERLVEYSRFGRRCRFRKHQELYEQGSTSSKFYFVRSGLVQVSIIRSDGTEVVLEYMGPETICGEGAAFDGLPRFSGAVAVEDTDAIEFDTAHMEELFREHPEFALALLRITSLKQRVLAVRLEYLASRDPEGRIMDLLHRLSEMFAVDHPKGRLLITHLTHEQIAAMTGTSRVTVTRTLLRLRKQKVVDVVEGYILVRSARRE